MRWEIAPILEFRRYARDWDELNESRGGLASLSSTFLLPLLHIFSSGQELLVRGSDSGGVRAIGILQPRGWMWESFQPSQLPVGAWVSDQDWRPELLSGLFSALSGAMAGISITKQDPRLTPRPAGFGEIDTIDYIDTAWIDIEGSFESYWSRRESKLRQEVTRRMRRLAGSGTQVSLESIREPERMHAAIAAFGALESAGWKGREGTAIDIGNPQGRFYSLMMEGFARTGQARVYRCWFGSRLAAMQLCVTGSGVVVFLKTAYDEALKEHGPGILMQRLIVEEIFKEGAVKRVEFYGRTGSPQAKWSDGNLRTMYHLNWYRSRLLRRLVRFRRRVTEGWHS